MASLVKKLFKWSFVTAGAVALIVVIIALLAPYEPRGLMSRDEYGDRWPLTVDEGIVECIPWSAVVFHARGETYAVNGLALGRRDEEGWRDIAEIWRDNPNYFEPQTIDDVIQLSRAGATGPKVDISPVLNTGLSLCD